MKLKYVGPDPAETGIVPLPEGWPAEDHDEPDRQVAAAKLEHRVKLSLNKNGTIHYGPNTYERADEKKEEPRAEPSAEVEV